MKYAQVMSELEKQGTAQNRKIYARHGAREPMFGVSFANLGKLVKKIKIDHDLAVALWESGNTDARVLATMIVDPARMGSRELDRWARESDYYMLTDYVAQVTGFTRVARKKADTWRARKAEYVARCGWVLSGRLANSDPDLPDSYFEALIKEAEAGIHDAPNRTKEAMNQALILIGGRNKSLRKKVAAAAKRIGTVEVDHGDTSCKTPAIVPYVDKMWAHAEKKGFASPAEQERARNRKGAGCAR